MGRLQPMATSLARQLATLPLASKAQFLPLSKHLERERDLEESLPSYPVNVMACAPLPHGRAAELWREVRTDSRLENVVAILATDETHLFEDDWTSSCASVSEMLSRFEHAASTPPKVSARRTRTLDALLNRTSTRALLRRFGVDAPGPDLTEDELYDGLEEDGLSEVWDAVTEARHWPREQERPTEKAGGLTLTMTLGPIYLACSGESADRIAWDFPYDQQGPSVVYLVEAPERWMAPALLGWRFTVDAWVSYAPILRAWHSQLGWDPVALGRAELEAFVPHRPKTLADVRRIVGELGSLCPDSFADTNLPADVLSHKWKLWWD